MQKQVRNLGIATLTALFAFGIAVRADDEKDASKNPLLGSWELEKIKYGEAPEYSDFPKERRRLKLITPTHWSWVEYDNAGPKEVKFAAGGSYSLKDETYTETIDFAPGEMVQFLDKKHAFKSVIKGDKWFVSGEVDGVKIADIWKRVK